MITREREGENKIILWYNEEICKINEMKKKSLQEW